MFFGKKRHKRAVKRMENSVLDLLKIEGCMIGRDTIKYRTGIPEDVLPSIISRLIAKKKIKSSRQRDPETGRFVAGFYCENIDRKKK